MSKVNYVSEDELKEDVRILYETNVFPERLAKNLQSMCDHICNSHRFSGYTFDWKEEMKSQAILTLVRFLNERKYDNTRPNTKVFSWATKVIFLQFLCWLEKKNRKLKQEKKIQEEMKGQLQ